MTQSQSTPETCPSHNTAQLIRMGVNIEGTDYVVALAGNPNTGKSTVFNTLTGLRQHTGNWPGKTVTRAEGAFQYGDCSYKLVDLPGTYSLLATSVDEQVARDFLLFARPDVTLVVLDACRLERNLNLALQVLEITDRVVICLNLMDEARRKNIRVDAERLAAQLGVPVVPTAARYKEGMPELLRTIHGVATGEITCNPRRLGDDTFRMQPLVDRLGAAITEAYPQLPNSRWVALRLLDADESILAAVQSGQLGDLSRDNFVTDRSGADDSQPAGPSQPTEAVTSLLSLTDELRWQVGPEFHQSLVEGIYTEAASLADQAVHHGTMENETDWDRKLDSWLTSRWTGLPIMIAMLAGVLWLTIAASNVPSGMLAWLLVDTIHPLLKSAAETVHCPEWLSGLLVDGVYRATAWVVAVMLPPMAIFFPLFTLLEDFGYLPRVAFNLDKTFRRCGAHGKQALTTCMGFGCNAAGVVATRVIDSPRERLIAIITNNFSLCNGRWPTQILIATIFLGALAPSFLSGAVATAAVVGIALLGVGITFGTAWLLSRTVLQGEASSFHLELPPYRPPRLLQTLYTSLIDRTLIVLWRAIVFAVPAGAAIWLVANVHIGDHTIATVAVDWLDPMGLLIGLNGVILLAYVVAIPANEIVIPTILMLTVTLYGQTDLGQGAGVMFELDSQSATESILRGAGWTCLTGVNLMLFSLLHNPCSTTIFTIWKETRSAKWTAVASLLPLVMGFAACFLVAQLWRIAVGG